LFLEEILPRLNVLRVLSNQIFLKLLAILLANSFLFWGCNGSSDTENSLNTPTNSIPPSNFVGVDGVTPGGSDTLDPYIIANHGGNGRKLGKNKAPTSNAGPDQTVSFPDSVLLQGSASDDGLPDGVLYPRWYRVRGPAEVIFENWKSFETTISFSEPGEYVIRLAVSDGYLTATDEVNITVSSDGPHPTPTPTPPPTPTPEPTPVDDGLPLYLHTHPLAEPESGEVLLTLDSIPPGTIQVKLTMSVKDADNPDEGRILQQ